MARSIRQHYAFKGDETEPFTVLLKTDPIYGWRGRKTFWHIWQEFSPCSFMCLFSASISQPWLSKTSFQSSVSGSPSILSTTAASLTWVRIWGKGSQQSLAFPDYSRIFSQGEKGIYTCTFHTVSKFHGNRVKNPSTKPMMQTTQSNSINISWWPVMC